MRKQVNTQDVVAWYTEQHLTMEQIGRLLGISRQAVMKRLHKAGVTREDGERVKRVCAYCAMPISLPRSHAHQINTYCSADHYYAARSNSRFTEWRHGSRLARAIVSQHYPLTREQVVHHKDGNQRNNDLANLAVYATQADHLAMHHGRPILPVWDGGQPQSAPSVVTRPAVGE